MAESGAIKQVLNQELHSPARSRSSSPAITTQSAAHSYQTREVDFTIDDGVRRSSQHSPRLEARQFASPSPLRDSESPPGQSPIVYQPNEKIIHIESSITDCGIIGTIRSVTHGTWHSRPACLIVLLFRYKWTDTRFKQTRIELTFERRRRRNSIGSKSPALTPPVVRNLSPRKVYGTKNTEERSWHFDLGLELGLPAGPASLSPSGGFGNESSFTREHHMEIVGKPWMTKDAAEYNQAIWTAKETATQKHGIPDELNLAVVVECDGPFEAVVDVDGKTSRGMTLRAWPWPRKSPLQFMSGVNVGQAPSTLEFEKITEPEWRALAPYTREYQDVVSMVSSSEDLRSIEPSDPLVKEIIKPLDDIQSVGFEPPE